MSYSIYIGNAELQKIDKSDYTEDDAWAHGLRPNYYVRVNAVTLADAPTFPNDAMTGNSNNRHPAYSVWRRTMKDAGLEPWMFDAESGIISGHPGCVPIDQQDLLIVTQAIERWQARNPGAIPGWCNCATCDPGGATDQEHEERDGTLARLIWLHWWIDWALKNCERPAISNS